MYVRDDRARPLTHSLNGGAGRAQCDDHIHELRLGPAAIEFLLQYFQFPARQTLNLGKPARLLGEDGALSKSSDILLVPNVMLPGVGRSHLLELCVTDASQWVGQLGGSIAAHEIGSVVGKLPVGGGNAVILFIVLHGVRVRLRLRAGGGRATRAVQAHGCGLWPLSK